MILVQSLIWFLREIIFLWSLYAKEQFPIVQREHGKSEQNTMCIILLTTTYIKIAIN
jgi:hypothetical protein